MANLKINPTELKQIIKEEALRLKNKMMLEAEKASILKRLQEIEECEMMEENPIQEGTDFGANADQMLATPNFQKAAQNVVVSLFKKGPNALGDWAKTFFAGKNPQDNAQANEIYRNMLAAYKNIWKNAYIQNQGNMVNMKFDPMAGTFTKGTGPSSGNWAVGGLGENEKK